MIEPSATIIRFQAALSSGKSRAPQPGSLSALLAGRKGEPRQARSAFAARWSAFIRAHFDSPLHAAVYFDMDEKSGRHWWDGTNTPQGWVVDYAVANIPGAAEWLALS